MKKKMLIALALASTITTAQAGDTLFGSLGDTTSKVTNMFRSTIPTEVTSLEADGGNFRLYQFVAPYNNNYVCFVAAGTQKGAGACYPLDPSIKLSKDLN